MLKNQLKTSMHTQSPSHTNLISMTMIQNRSVPFALNVIAMESIGNIPTESQQLRQINTTASQTSPIHPISYSIRQRHRPLPPFSDYPFRKRNKPSRQSNHFLHPFATQRSITSWIGSTTAPLQNLCGISTNLSKMSSSLPTSNKPI